VKPQTRKSPDLLHAVNLDASFLKRMENKNDKYRKAIVAGNH
jgi:hypothetical protein